MTNLKPYDISKRRVLEAYWRVKANRGAAGIAGLDITIATRFGFLALTGLESLTCMHSLH